MPTEFQTVLSMIGTLVLLVAIFFAAYWFTKAMGKRYQLNQSSTTGGIELLVRQMLGKDQMLLVIRTGGRVFLLGATPQHIELIEELNAADYEDATPSSAVPDENFLHLLKGLTKGGAGKKGDDGNGMR